MNKLGAVLVSCFVGLSLTACSTTAVQEGSAAAPLGSGSAIIKTETIESGSAAPDTGSGSGSASTSSDPNTRTYGDCTISILEYSLREDSDGEPALRVVYEFTNSAKNAASFSTTVIPNAYQVDTDTPLSFTTPAEHDSEYSATLTLVASGDSVICAGYFKLSDTTTPVQMKITDLRDSSAKALTRTLDIADMEIEPYEQKSSAPLTRSSDTTDTAE